MSDILVGLETHLPLNCDSKMFCSCPIVSKGAEPNSATCPTCLGMPGSKPVLNRKVAHYAIKLALALNCTIEGEIAFSRKTYFYPDMNKNFQISQYDIPLGRNGFVELANKKKIRIRRVHMEEDPGALVHEAGTHSSNYCLVDYNRAGVPLCEIVTEPDISSQEEAKEFLNKLNILIDYLDIFDSGKFVIKADTNVSVKGGERVEIKNVTGTKNIEIALNYEVIRQKGLIESGKKVVRETRGFDEATGTTKTLRKKETEEDYGFIIDTDLVPIKISEKWKSEIKEQIPELPSKRLKRFLKEYNLSGSDIILLCSNLELSKLFEEVVKSGIDVTLAVRFLTRELLAILNYNNLNLKGLQLDPVEVTALLKLLQSGKVTERNAKEAMIKYANEKIMPKEFLEKNNLLKDMSGGDVEKIVEKVLKENKAAVDDYGRGEKKSLNFLVGLVMRETKGKAEPRVVQKLILEKLGG